MHLLQPLLTNARKAQLPSQVLSILLTGREASLDFENLELKTGYSTSKCLAYATTMTTLSFHELARQSSEISGNRGIAGPAYIHVNPGIVKTGVMRYLPWYMRAFSHAGYAILTPWRMEVEECGERCLEMGFAERYSASGADEAEELEGVGGQKGAYTVFNKGEETGTKDIVKSMLEQGAGRKVWEHTLGVFAKVERDGRL